MIATNDHRAVVQRRIRVENGLKQLVHDCSIDDHASVDVILQARLALDHDESAMAALRETPARRCDFTDHAIQLDLATAGP